MTEKGKKKKDKVAETARLLFRSQGFRDTTMDQIGQKLNIGRTTLYDYFGSKQDILFYLLEKHVLVDQEVILSGGFPNQMKELMNLSLNRLKNNIDLYTILFTQMPALGGEAAEKLNQWQRIILDKVSQVVSEAIESREFQPWCTAEQVVFMFQAILSQRMNLILVEHNLFGVQNPNSPDNDQTEYDQINNSQNKTNPNQNPEEDTELLVQLMIRGTGGFQ